MLSFRCCNILKDILITPRGISKRDFANKYHVSEQSIRYDVYKIRSWLEIEAINISLKYTKTGLKIFGTNKNVKNLVQIFQKKYKQNYTAVEKRIPYIIFSLLTNSDYITVGKLSETLLVSSSTIIRDVNAAEAALNMLQIELERKKHWGMRLSISELKRRQAMEYFILSMFDAKQMERIFSSKKRIPAFFPELLCEYILDGLSAEHLRKRLDRFCAALFKAYKEKLNLEEYMELLVRICISLRQARNRFALDDCMESFGENIFIRSSAHIELKGEIEKIFADFALQAAAEEVQWIMLPVIIKSWKVREIDFKKSKDIVMKLINKACRSMQVPFHLDEELFNNLSVYINKIFVKRQFALAGINPLGDDIIYHFRNFYEIIKKISSEVFDKYGIGLLDEEISYIALYFYLSCERLCEKRKIRTLVVWSIQSPVNKFLVKQLENNFNDLQIISCCAVSEAEKMMMKYSIDLAVSIVPLKLKIPCVVVNIFLQKEDIWKIYRVLMNLKERQKLSADLYIKNM